MDDSTTQSLTLKFFSIHLYWGAQWLSGRVLDSRLRGRGFELHRRHWVVVLEQDTFILAKLLVKPRKTCPCITERLLMGREESNQTNKQHSHYHKVLFYFISIVPYNMPFFRPTTETEIKR